MIRCKHCYCEYKAPPEMCPARVMDSPDYHEPVQWIVQIAGPISDFNEIRGRIERGELVAVPMEANDV